MKTIVLSGALANKPYNGGNAWSRLGWVLGFKRLGYDVLFVEQISKDCCRDEAGAVCPLRDSINLKFFQAVADEFGLSGSVALLCEDSDEGWGLPFRSLADRLAEAGMLFNFGGHLTQPELLSRPRHKVYFDDDPGFTQFWHSAGNGGARCEGHDQFYTLGANIGSGDCEIPTGGITWVPIRPPVVLGRWAPPSASPQFDRFTTVASWRGAYGPVEYQGKTYGLKVHEFRKCLELPGRTGAHFEIALDIHPGERADLEALRRHGWKLVDPRVVAGTPRDYHDYLHASSAEFSVAQGIYVHTNSGWFSDRTARYLAAGKPALVQETGACCHLPVGAGLMTFRELDEAVEGANRIVADYQNHCRAARRLAEEYFDSDQIVREVAVKAGLPLP